jgi:hypothetical protein
MKRLSAEHIDMGYDSRKVLNVQKIGCDHQMKNSKML